MNAANTNTDKFTRLEDAIDGFITEQQLRTLRSMEWSHGTFKEFASAIQQAAAKRLHPMRGHVYPRDQWLKDENREKLLLGVKIDGLRHIAERSGEYAGQRGPYWYDADGSRTEMWLADDYPAAAMVEILRHDFQEPMRGIARWDDYAPYKKGGDLFYMWQQMGPHMLAKCAEANGHRKAFQVGDLYIEAEMHRDRPESHGPQTDGQQASTTEATGQVSTLNDALGSDNEESSTDPAPEAGERDTDDVAEAESASQTGDRAETSSSPGKPSDSEAPGRSRPSGDESVEYETISTESQDGDGKGQLGYLFAVGVHEGPYTKGGLKKMVEGEFGVDKITHLAKSDFDAAKDLLDREQMAVRYNKAASGKAGTAEMFDAEGEPASESSQPSPSELDDDRPLQEPCPYCGAPDGEPCVTSTGEPADYYHKAREEQAAAKEGNKEAMISRAQAHAKKMADEAPTEDQWQDFMANVAVEVADWPDEEWEQMVQVLEAYWEGAREELDLRRTPEELRQ